jgi:hypothetical protein
LAIFCPFGRGSLLMLATSAGVLAPQQALAQNLSASGLTFGQPARNIDVRAGVDVLYDSNIARTSAAGAVARKLERADYRVSPMLDVDLSVLAGPAVLTLRGGAGYSFHARNEKLDSERIDLTAGAGARLKGCDVGLQAGFARSQRDLADLAIVPGDPEASSVNIETNSRIGSTATCGSGYFRPTAFVERRWSRNSDEDREISNFDVLSYGGGFSLRRPTLGVVTVFVGQSEFDYPERRGIPGGVREFRLRYGGVRLDRRLGARLQLNGQVSYVDTKVPGSSLNRFKGVNWDVATSLRLGDRAQVTLGMYRQVDASAGFNSRMTQTTGYSAEATYVLTPLMRLAVSGSHRVRKFDVDSALTPTIPLSRDSLDDIGARLAYSPGRRLSFVLSTGYQSRDASDAVYNYSAVRASLGGRIKL